MTTPLEPLPTKQLAAMPKEVRSVEISVEPSSSEDNKGNVYPWLLGASTCLSIALCWLYVTKPVIENVINPNATSLVTTVETGMNNTDSNTNSNSVTKVSQVTNQNKDTTQLIPSDDGLPGQAAVVSEVPVKTSGFTNMEVMDELQLSGWEKTNLKVQHILNADSGSGEVEKIVIDVPVFYQTRSMRWNSRNIASARDVLKKLMVYEGNLSKLKSEGESLLEEWNTLLANTVPEEALRADSPSLPYNHSRLNKSDAHTDSESLIKVQN